MKENSKLNPEKAQELARSIFILLKSENPSSEKVRALIKAGADVNAIIDGHALLYYACEKHPDQSVIELFVSSGANVNYNDDEALRVYTSHYQDYNILKFLIDSGADPSANNSEALQNICKPTVIKPTVVKLLINGGADASANNNLAIRNASARGNTDVVKILISNGADIRAGDDYAFKIAVKNDYTELLDLILKRHPDLLSLFKNLL